MRFDIIYLYIIKIDVQYVQFLQSCNLKGALTVSQSGSGLVMKSGRILEVSSVLLDAARLVFPFPPPGLSRLLGDSQGCLPRAPCVREPSFRLGVRVQAAGSEMNWPSEEHRGSARLPAGRPSVRRPSRTRPPAPESCRRGDRDGGSG